MPEPPAVCAGIDLGGTKIEATLFDADLSPLQQRRRATPQGDYEALLAALVAEVHWLRDQSGTADLPIGLGLPGLVDPVSGLSHTANLPAGGRPLAADLKARSGVAITVANDCKCFALSEANGGAGAGAQTVFGLILGTGLGGGVCVDGQLLPGPNLLAGEIGHAALPAGLVQAHDLPLLPCGCGRLGCYETYVSGRGLSALVEMKTGRKLRAEEIVAASLANEAEMTAMLNLWAALAGELLHGVQLHLDPDVIVLGGGLSNMAGITKRLSNALQEAALPNLKQPDIRIARYGDSSGGRGAALLAAKEKDQIA